MTDSMPSRGKLERYLALLAAAACSLISIRVFQLVGSMQPVWPLPALYLVEVTSLTWVGAWVLIREPPSSAAVVCAVAGVLAGFSILGVDHRVLLSAGRPPAGHRRRIGNVAEAASFARRPGLVRRRLCRRGGVDARHPATAPFPHDLLGGPGRRVTDIPRCALEPIATLVQGG